jgi:hypothetical protein
VSLQAGEVLQVSLARSTRLAGLLILLIATSPQAHRWPRVENLSVLMAWLTGYVTLELVRGDRARGAVALVIGAAVKYAQLILLPLHVALRRWRTIAWTASLGVGFLLLSLLIMGFEPYKTFARDIEPTLKKTRLEENQALYRFVLISLGAQSEDAMPRGAEIVFRVVQFGLLAAMVGLILIKPRSHWMNSANVFGAALALIAWLSIFSPVFWEHYHAYFCPFWGWLVYEAMRSRVKLVLVIIAIGFAYLPTSLLIQQMHWKKLPEPFFSHLLWSAIIMWGLGLASVVSRQTRTSYSPSPAGDSDRC